MHSVMFLCAFHVVWVGLVPGPFPSNPFRVSHLVRTFASAYYCLNICLTDCQNFCSFHFKDKGVWFPLGRGFPKHEVCGTMESIRLTSLQGIAFYRT